jgi:hypothetical protein
MNPQNHDDLTNELGRAMHHRADGISGSPITLGDVKGTATRIRRRRAITASVAVAAAAAIIVPTAMMSSNLLPDGSGDDNPPATASQSPTTVKLGEPLDVSNLELGSAPRVAWIEGGRVLHTADGGTVQLDRAYTDVVRYDDGYLATYTDNEGVATGVLLDAIGNRVGDSFATAYSLAMASDGEQVLYVRDGKLLVHDNGTGETETVRTDAGVETEPIAVTSDAAYYNVQLADYSSDARWWRDGEEHDPRPAGLFAYSSVTDDGWVVATDELTDAGNCSVVLEPSGDEVGRTCDFTLDAFSPDASHILGGPAYRSGYGDGELAVTNRDGVGTEAAVVLGYLQTGQSDATFMDARWEGDSHILAVMTTPIPGSGDKTWQLVRIGLDGSVENAADPVRGEELPQFAPFAFAN